MNKPNFSKFTRDMKVILSKRSPEILTGIGIAGMVTSTVLAVRATPKAMRLIDEAKSEKNEDLKTIEIVKVAWKPYIPATVTGVASIACLIGASKVNLKRNAALATAYKLSETALTEYKEKVVETIGEKKEQIVRDKIAEEKVKENPVVTKEVYITGSDDTLFLDPLTNRYFKSNIDKIKRSINNLNAAILEDPFDGGVSLNDFYDEIGLPHADVGKELGWSIDKGRIKIDFNPQLITDDDGKETPCLVLDYRVPPKYGYNGLS